MICRGGLDGLTDDFFSCRLLRRVQQVLLHTDELLVGGEFNRCRCLKKRANPPIRQASTMSPDLVSFAVERLETRACLGVERAASHLSIP